MTVQRARRVQRFLSQPFHVAEQFTGRSGKYVPLAETIRGFAEIIDGKHDDLPEDAFYMVGTIDEAVEKAKELSREDEDPQDASKADAPKPAEEEPEDDGAAADEEKSEEGAKASDESKPEAKATGEEKS